MEFGLDRVPYHLLAVLVGLVSYSAAHILKQREPDLVVVLGALCLALVCCFLIQPFASGLKGKLYTAIFLGLLILGTAIHARDAAGAWIDSCCQLGLAVVMAGVLVFGSCLLAVYFNPMTTMVQPAPEFLTLPLSVFGTPLLIHIARDLYQSYRNPSASQE